MGHTYIKFLTEDIIEKSKDGTPRTWIIRALESSVSRILKTILPKANPDFDAKIDLIKQWILEFDEAGHKPTREIGLDQDGTIIAIMPWKENYGFWTDSNATIEDFSNSGTVIINQTSKNFGGTSKPEQAAYKPSRRVS